MHLTYIENPVILEIQSLFATYEKDNKLLIQCDSSWKTREALFQFFEIERFKELYWRLGLISSAKVGLERSNLVMQSMPTPRVFKPGQHGTSFHCDYWYGHGLSSHTVWTPLSTVDEGNTFHVCQIDMQAALYDKLVSSGFSSDLEKELLKSSFPLMPGQGTSVIFGSKTLHGSPLNL
jgi:hypothetical protein